VNTKRNEKELNLIRLAEFVGAQTNLKVVKLRFFRQGGRLILRVTIDKEGSVSLDDCERFSRAYSDILDQEDLIEERYYLEVESPGIKKALD
jgi:ribosome maturation factor RimP